MMSRLMRMAIFPNLRKVLILCGLLLAVTVAALSPSPSLSQESAAGEAAETRRVVVRFLTEGDFPPFNYLDEDGVLNGFNVDLARALCNEIGAACDIRVRPWDELLIALKRGEADAIIAGHAVTAEALRDVEFTDRYFYTPGRFAAKIETEKVEITPDQLYNRSIAVARGTPHEAFLKTFFRDSRVQVFQTAEQAREALQQGKTDYVFDDGIGLAFWINGTLSRRCCELRGAPFFEPRFFGDGVAIAVPRNDPQIKALLNAALQKVRASGRFDELVSRYFPHRVF
ncbi:MAG: transporter substrate-binding domain-containing protein [Deltaproteobacteria bacterium]